MDLKGAKEMLHIQAWLVRIEEIHAGNQRRMVARMNPRTTVELDASHASLASQPAAAVDLIEEAITAAGA